MWQNVIIFFIKHPALLRAERTVQTATVDPRQPDLISKQDTKYGWVKTFGRAIFCPKTPCFPSWTASVFGRYCSFPSRVSSRKVWAPVSNLQRFCARQYFRMSKLSDLLSLVIWHGGLTCRSAVLILNVGGNLVFVCLPYTVLYVVVRQLMDMVSILVVVCPENRTACTSTWFITWM